MGVFGGEPAGLPDIDGAGGWVWRRALRLPLLLVFCSLVRWLLFLFCPPICPRPLRWCLYCHVRENKHYIPIDSVTVLTRRPSRFTISDVFNVFCHVM